MGRYLEHCKRWVNFHIKENYKWQESTYLPKVTYKKMFIWCFKGLVCELILVYFFYSSWIAAVVFFPLAVALAYWQWETWKRQVLFEIEVGFRDWLYYVKGGLTGGKSIEYAILECRENFAHAIVIGHPILLGLEQLYRGLELHIPIEQCIQRFGEETQVEVIEDFATVFEISKKQGVNMSGTLERTMQQIYDRISLWQEIYSMIAAKKMEHRIMCVMPFFILFFVGRASGGYFTSLYHNIQGILIMTVCFVIYLIGVWWGERLTEVRI